MEALEYAKDNKLKIFILGGGSNILVNDKGFDGLVIKLKVKSEKLKVTIQDLKFLLRCWAGNSLASLVNFAKENSLSGLEWATGIPGTVGGAVRGNAGAFQTDMGSMVSSLGVIDTVKENLKIEEFKVEDCDFNYKDSMLKKKPNLVMVSCVLKLVKGDKVEIEEKMKEYIQRRSGGNYPNPKDPSAGSFFQNPLVNKPELIARFERDAGCQCREGKIPAGWLIDEMGLRGKKIGGAEVSEDHANFVVNSGGASAQDVAMLASFIKMKVRDGLGVQLKEEVQYVGF